MKTNKTTKTVPEKVKLTDKELSKIAEKQSEGLENFELKEPKSKGEIPSRTRINKIYTEKVKEAEEKIRQK